MDIDQWIFPFIMAVITNSLMIIIVYFLRKIPAFANAFSLWFMVILYLFCLLRIVVPIELPDLQIVIEDQAVYTWFVDEFQIYDPNHNGSYLTTVGWIIVGIWVAVAVIIGVRSLIVQRSFRKYLMANGDYATDEERAVFSEVAKEVLESDKNVSLRKTDAISGAVIIGLRNKTVLIPDTAYTADELQMIFRHECMHIKEKDLWLKLLVQIYCFIFWWNPFAYLLKRDLDLTLEMKCDLNTTGAYSDEQILLYIETLRNRSIAATTKRMPFLVSAELVDGKRKDRLTLRIKKLLADPPKKAKRVVLQTLTVTVLLAVFVASYIFIWQPRFDLSDIKEEYYELKENERIIDGSNAYLLKSDDGNYLLYYSDYDPMPVPKEEVEQGMYEGYPIYEK